MAKKIIKTPTYVNAPGTIRTDFWYPDFDVLVDNKGYDVVWERAVPCPCQKRSHPQSVCKNCQGTGWVFINPKQIKAVSQSINKSTKYKEWSQELIGTASFTVRSDYHLNYMDKITILNSSSPQSENLIVKKFQDLLLVNVIYSIQSIVEVFKFDTNATPLILLNENQYVIENNFIRFLGNSVKEDDSITVTYMHPVQYYILDLNHDVRNTILLDNTSRENPVVLPVSAIGRRAHNVIESSNYTGDNLFDNSYEV